jgi:O-succinylbenzoate synthase
MKIEKIDLFHVKMPMKEVWRTAFSEETEIDSVLIRIEADGHVGWGETAPYRSPQYSPEWAGGVFTLLRDWLSPTILGRDLNSGEKLGALLGPFKGNYFAKAGLDLAWWDAYAKSLGEPLWKTIGGKNNRVTVGADISVMEDLNALIECIGKSVDAGFKRVKLKFRPGWGLKMVAAVRQEFPDTVFHVDCNSGFRLDDLEMFKELDRYDLAMIEQPLAFDDLADHARLQMQIDTPICLDESIISLDRARKAIQIGACKWVNLKVGRVGGLTNALAIHNYCLDHGIPCWVGGMLESAVGQGPSLALSTLSNIHYPCDVFPSARFYETDLAEPEIVLAEPSIIQAPETPGHGYAPNAGRLEALAVRKTTLYAP